MKSTLALCAIVAASTFARPAHADDAPPPRVPDASLRAVKDHVVRLELDGGAPAVEGRELDFDATSVTIAVTTTSEVVNVQREHVVRMMLVEQPATATTQTATPVAPVERMRVFGLQFSLLGTVAADADYKYLHGFISTNLLLPITTASGDVWFAGSLGGGLSLPLGRTTRWKFDVFGEVSPLRTTSYYTYLGFGVGAGFHYTAASGFTLGFTIPVLGVSTRLGSSPYGYDASFRYNDAVGYYYLSAIAGMPLVTMGYRFATRCPRRN